MINSSQLNSYLAKSELDPTALKAIEKKSEKITSVVNSGTGKLVDSYANQKIIDAKSNVIGNRNSFDIINQNYSQNDLTGSITDSAVSSLQKDVENLYYTNIISALVDSGVSNYSKSTLQNLAGTQIEELAEQNIRLAVEDKTYKIFNTTTSGSENGILEIIGSVLGLGFSSEVIDSKYANNIAANAIKDSANFDINNAENTKKKAKTQDGFVDPTGNYPTADYNDLSDTNKLAQGEIRGTPMQDRIKNRMRGAKLPNGESWDQPESSYKAQYPYNKVHQTESGHIIEFDDTPGAERIHIFHRNGSFFEIDPNGSVISRTVGSEYKIIDRNGYIAISGKANVSVNGSCNIHVGGDCNIEVVGDAVINSGNDAQVNAAGRLQLSAGEAIDMRAPKIYIEADEEFHLTADVKANIDVKLLNVKSDTDINVQSTTKTNVKVGEDLNVQAAGKTNVKTTGDMNVQADGTTNIKAGSNIRVESSAGVDIKAAQDFKVQSVMGSFKFSGNMAMDYATGQFANGQSVDASGAGDAGEASPAETATYSQSGIIDKRSPMLEDILDDPQSMTLADQYSLLVENEGEDYNTQRQKLIDLGLATPAELDAEPIISDSDSSAGSAKNDIVMPSSDLKSVTSLPDSYQLSPHFTLGMLSSLAAVTKDKVVAQRSLSYGEIVYNLQYIALNVLEPIYAVYPNMIVTSAFRSEASSSGTSQHPLGMAVDIQFKGMQKKDYFETAKKLKECVQFDQFLLEYCNYTNNPWIHISMNPNSVNRNQTLTFWNHRKHSEGLSNLA